MKSLLVVVGQKEYSLELSLHFQTCEGLSAFPSALLLRSDFDRVFDAFGSDSLQAVPAIAILVSVDCAVHGSRQHSFHSHPQGQMMGPRLHSNVFHNEHRIPQSPSQLFCRPCTSKEPCSPT